LEINSQCDSNATQPHLNRVTGWEFLILELSLHISERGLSLYISERELSLRISERGLSLHISERELSLYISERGLSLHISERELIAYSHGQRIGRIADQNGTTNANFVSFGSRDQAIASIAPN